MNPAANNNLVEMLASTIRHGGAALADAPGLLREILETEAWRDFAPRIGSPVHHDRFIDFVTTPPVKGMGVDIALVKRIVADDPVTTDLLDQALQNPPSKHVGAFDNVQGIEAPTGNAQDAALRRLRKDAPDLHAEVLSGVLSAHAAMVKAGFRPKTFTVRADDPEAIARTLRKQLPPETFDALLSVLEDMRVRQ